MTERVEQPQSQVRAGIARGDITPPVGIYHRMWGAALHDRSTGVHRPLTATVLAMASPTGNDSHEVEVAIALDHCLLWPREMNDFLDRVSELSGAKRSSLNVYFSHTHGAGLMGLERRNLPGGDLVPDYLTQMAQRVAKLVSEAVGELVPATIVYGSGRCGLAANRDYFDAKYGGFVCGFNPDGKADDSIVVGRISDNSGKSLGTIVNYACHPTTLAWDNTLISPDYVGAMREVVEGATGTPCFFVQGASGDIGPRAGFVGDTEVADRNGRQLGHAVLSALEGLMPPRTSFVYTGPVVSGATIGTWKSQPYSPERAARSSVWVQENCEVELAFRADLPRRRELDDAFQRWQAEEQVALVAGDTARARDARAMAERATRRMTRVEHLPETASIVYRARLLRMGDVIWIPLDGEHYNVLQTTLRTRFPNLTLVIGTLINGSTVWYLPNAQSYGKGLYQEEASVLAQGSLEKLIDALTESIQKIS